MPPTVPYQASPITRDEVDAIAEPVVLDFGTDWCGHCKAAAPLVAAAAARHPGVRHLRIEDGPGRRLGRSFAVKLWPTLIFLNKGSEVARLVRPGDPDAIEQAFNALEGAR